MRAKACGASQADCSPAQTPAAHLPPRLDNSERTLPSLAPVLASVAMLTMKRTPRCWTGCLLVALQASPTTCTSPRKRRRRRLRARVATRRRRLGHAHSPGMVSEHQVLRQPRQRSSVTLLATMAPGNAWMRCGALTTAMRLQKPWVRSAPTTSLLPAAASVTADATRRSKSQSLPLPPRPPGQPLGEAVTTAALRAVSVAAGLGTCALAATLGAQMGLQASSPACQTHRCLLQTRTSVEPRPPSLPLPGSALTWCAGPRSSPPHHVVSQSTPCASEDTGYAAVMRGTPSCCDALCRTDAWSAAAVSTEQTEACCCASLQDTNASISSRQPAPPAGARHTLTTWRAPPRRPLANHDTKTQTSTAHPQSQ